MQITEHTPYSFSFMTLIFQLTLNQLIKKWLKKVNEIKFARKENQT